VSPKVTPYEGAPLPRVNPERTLVEVLLDVYLIVSLNISNGTVEFVLSSLITMYPLEGKADESVKVMLVLEAVRAPFRVVFKLKTEGAIPPTVPPTFLNLTASSVDLL
jgi:hypothetical protein